MMSNITRFDPLSEMQRMSDMFDRLFGSPLVSSHSFITAPRESTVPLDVIEKEGKLLVRAAVPGVSPDELNVSIENNVLTISGEMKHEQEDENDKVYYRECCYGSFSRSIRLPEHLQIDKVDAEFSNGYVIITIPKLPEAQPQSLKVPIRKTK